jgi:hypothetical protein
MKLNKFENDICHRANEVFYFAFFGVFVGLFFPISRAAK